MMSALTNYDGFKLPSFFVISSFSFSREAHKFEQKNMVRLYFFLLLFIINKFKDEEVSYETLGAIFSENIFDLFGTT